MFCFNKEIMLNYLAKDSFLRPESLPLITSNYYEDQTIFNSLIISGGQHGWIGRQPSINKRSHFDTKTNFLSL